MKHYKVIKEHSNHFEVHDARDGRTFKVAKKGLGKQTVDKIQRFADGGVVAPEPSFAGDMVGSADAGVPVPPPAEQGPAVNQLDPALSAVVQGPLLADDPAVRKAGYDAAMTRIDDNIAKKKSDEVAKQKAADEASAAEVQQAADAAEKKDADYRNQFTAAATTAPVAAPTVRGGVGPAFPGLSAAPSTGGIDRAEAAQEAATKAAADIQVQKAKEAEAVQAGLAQQQAEQKQRFERNFNIAQGVSAALGIATSLQRVNPDKYWADRSNGQKMMAGAAMVLGGAAAGTLHTSNAAIQVIENAIDRDIRAQQDNIKQFDGLYKKHLDSMGSMQSAYAQTKADMLGVAQAKLNQLAAKYGGAEAQANAQAAVADLQKKKEEALYNVAAQQTAREDQHAVQKANYGVQQSELGLKRQQLALSAKASATAGGLDANKVALLAATGRDVPSEYQGLLPKEMGERTVTVRPGFVRVASNKKVADEANEAISNHQKLDAAIKNIRQFGSKAGVWPDADKQQYQTALFELSTGMAHELFGRVTEGDVNLVKNALPDKTSLMTTDTKANAALNSLLLMSKKKADAALKSALPGGK